MANPVPRRRWTDFPAGLRRVRASNGITQSELARMLDVDQATISRWERGAQIPDGAMQTRLRDLLFRGRAISDARLMHLVRTANACLALIGADGNLVALSDTFKRIAGTRANLNELMTPSLREAWDLAISGGFFQGELASVRFAAEVKTADGATVRLAGSLHPTTLADSSVLMLAECAEVSEPVYNDLRKGGPRVTPLEEIL